MWRIPGGRLAIALLLFVGLAGPALAQRPAETAPLVSATSTITREQIDKRIEQVSTIAELEAATKAKVLEQYRKAQAFLDDARKSIETRESFRRAAEEAPAEISRLREAAQSAKAPEPFSIAPKTGLTEIEQRLQKEKADLAALEARIADLQRVASDAESRPAAIRQRLAEARRQLEKLEEERKAPAVAEEAPVLAEARRWVTEAQIAALTAETRMLDDELLTAPARIELAKARDEEGTREIDAFKARIAALEFQLSERRRAEAERAKAEAKAAEREAAGKHPLLQRLAEQNAALSEELAAMAGRLEKLVAEQKGVEQQGKQIDEDFRSVRKKLEIAGLSEILGQVLLEQRRALSDERGMLARAAQYRSAAAREQATAEAGLRQIRYTDERKALVNPAAYVESQLAGLTSVERAALRAELTTLVASRRDLLDKALSTQESYLRGLAELDFLHQQLEDTVNQYGQFLDERLLWIRSTAPVSLERLLDLPRDALRILLPTDWLTVVEALPGGLLKTPASILALLAVIAIIVRTPWIRRRLEATGKDVGRVNLDQYPKTLEALGWTLLLAVRLPALFAIAGWALQSHGVSLLPLSAANDELAVNPDAGSFPESVGRAIGG
jgi:potassium efflux system protein